MSDKEIGALPSASAATGAELVHIVQGGNSRKATISGINSVVLADVDLSVTDIRLSGTPVVITGIDQFRELKINFRAVRSVNSEIILHLSTDGGSTFISGASDYSLFYDELATTNFAGIVVSSSGLNVRGVVFVENMGDATVPTSGRGYSWVGGASNDRYLTERQVAEVNNACRISVGSATTSGRLTVTGIF